MKCSVAFCPLFDEATNYSHGFPVCLVDIYWFVVLILLSRLRVSSINIPTPLIISCSFFDVMA